MARPSEGNHNVKSCREEHGMRITDARTLATVEGLGSPNPPYELLQLLF